MPRHPYEPEPPPPQWANRHPWLFGLWFAFWALVGLAMLGLLAWGFIRLVDHFA